MRALFDSRRCPAGTGTHIILTLGKQKTLELLQWISPAVIVGVMLYLHRLTRQDITDLRNRMTRLEERMARVEGALDVHRQFLVRNGRGTAA